jgi:hypothetical protein
MASEACPHDLDEGRGERGLAACSLRNSVLNWAIKARTFPAVRCPKMVRRKTVPRVRAATADRDAGSQTPTDDIKNQYHRGARLRDLMVQQQCEDAYPV